MTIDWPIKGLLQQGMIFSNCLVPNYGDCEGWGLVITARCDLANQKVPVLNYLPLVGFDDWVKEDGRLLVQARAEAEEEGSVAKLLKDLNAPESVLLGTPLPEVLTRLLDGLEPKQRKPFHARCQKAVARYAEFVKPDGPSIEWLKAEFPKLYGGIVRELMTHRLSGYYFLPRVEPQEPMGCYVVLLRQIGVMPTAVAARIPSGVSVADARDCLKGAEHFLRYGSRDEVAMPLGVLASPYIEHLMQTFSYLLTRIGLPNTDTAHISRYATVETI